MLKCPENSADASMTDDNMQLQVEGWVDLRGWLHRDVHSNIANFPKYRPTEKNTTITINATVMLLRVARYPVFQGSSCISAPISRLLERSYPGDEISRISIRTCQSPVTTHGDTVWAMHCRHSVYGDHAIYA